MFSCWSRDFFLFELAAPLWPATLVFLWDDEFLMTAFMVTEVADPLRREEVPLCCTLFVMLVPKAFVWRVCDDDDVFRRVALVSTGWLPW